MSKFLLDTNIVSAAMWAEPDPSVLQRLRKHGGECAMSSLTWHELRFGVGRLPRGKRKTVLEDFLEEVVEPTIPVLPYDDRAAVWHAAERARLEKAGRPSPFVDGQIAATAFVNGLTLVTDNLKDFGAFRGIKLVNWLAE